MNTSLTTPRVRRDLFGAPFGNLFDEFFSEMAAPERWLPLMARWPAELPTVMRARMDVLDKGTAYEIVVDLPGVKKEEINVAVEGRTVSITAEAKREREKKEGEKLLHSERYAASYARSFELPTEVTEKGADARFENGVLTLTLPKREPSAAKRLTVH
jgi:HSP20 family protein